MTLSERALLPIARLLIALQALLIITGGAVRLTGSGLGCPTWPECTADSYTPVEGQIEGTLHSWIEFGNRLLTFILFFAALAVIALVLKTGRRHARLLALSQIGGIFGQAILGGITVLTKLNPLAVAAHFLLSIILLAAAIALLHRLSGARVPRTRNHLVNLHTVLTFIVLIAGTLVTGAGPHAGDVTAPRLDVAIATVAAIHGLLVVALIAFTITLFIGKEFNALNQGRNWLFAFLSISLIQGIIGYAQYLLGVPELMVMAHLAGAALLWITAWQMRYLTVGHVVKNEVNERERS